MANPVKEVLAKLIQKDIRTTKSCITEKVLPVLTKHMKMGM